jgi:hypothetical protein
MTIVETLQRHRRTIWRVLVGGRAARVLGNRDEVPISAGRTFEEVETKADILCELGLSPGEFVVALTEQNGGRIRQRAFSERTGLSPSTVSRMLSEMEADGTIVRVRTGNGNVVCLPEKAASSRRLATPLQGTAAPQ